VEAVREVEVKLRGEGVEFVRVYAYGGVGLSAEDIMGSENVGNIGRPGNRWELTAFARPLAMEGGLLRPCMELALIAVYRQWRRHDLLSGWGTKVTGCFQTRRLLTYSRCHTLYRSKYT